MFAYHTPTRMKGSAIVQGLRSWASALHPQLPLSRKESQRLLTALTSSFRRQLDEVHTPQGSGDGRPQAGKPDDASFDVDRRQGLHSSSAAFADKHLASVLTSPLLSQTKTAKEPDVATVMVTLQKNPAKDPIELLEEYHEKGHATIPIAVACLEAFKKSLEVLPEAHRKATVADTAAGKRVLLWIWQNKIYEDEQFVQDARLIDLMVPLVMEEGREKYLWEWLELDMAVDYKDALPDRTPHWKAQRHPYRWKSRVVRAMVASKLDEDHSSFDAALLTLFRATELEKSFCIPLAGPQTVIGREMRHDPQRRYATKVELYDRFTEFTRGDRFVINDKSVPEFQACVCQLEHPTGRDPLPALALLIKIFHPGNRSPEWQNVRAYFTNAADHKMRRRSLSFCVRTIALLEDMGRDEDATWLIELAESLFHGYVKDIRQSVHKERILYVGEDRRYRKTTVDTKQEDKLGRIAMPDFAI